MGVGWPVSWPMVQSRCRSQRCVVWLSSGVDGDIDLGSARQVAVEVAPRRGARGRSFGEARRSPRVRAGRPQMVGRGSTDRADQADEGACDDSGDGDRANSGCERYRG
jgi:hypothetical protein